MACHHINTPLQAAGKGDMPQQHGHRTGRKGGAGALANIMRHAYRNWWQSGKQTVSLPVGAVPGASMRPNVSTGCSLMLGE